MIKYVLFSLIVLYSIFVAVKIYKSLKKGRCIGCRESCCKCNKEDL